MRIFSGDVSTDSDSPNDSWASGSFQFIGSAQSTTAALPALKINPHVSSLFTLII